MRSALFATTLALIAVTNSHAQPVGVLICGSDGQACCPPYQGTAGIIGPSHCDIGLGCNIAKGICESQCGKAGDVCCDGPDTVASQGKFYRDVSGSFLPKKPMCLSGSCDIATRRCGAPCGLNVGDACCGPQPSSAVATCLNSETVCDLRKRLRTSGTCISCGGINQPSCAGFQGCHEGLFPDPQHGKCVCNSSLLETHPVRQNSQCMPWPGRRATCAEPAGNGVSFHSISENQARGLKTGRYCVEAAFESSDGVLISDVDNPLIFDVSKLLYDERTPEGIMFRYLNRQIKIEDGNNPNPSNGLYDQPTGVNDTIPRVPYKLGYFASPDDQQPIDTTLVTPGIRLGHDPVTVDIHDEPINVNVLPSHSYFRVKLNPDVYLVPVQVWVLYSDSEPADFPESFPLERALTIFDRVPSHPAAEYHAIPPSPDVLSDVAIPLANIILEGDGKPATFGQTLPDDVWAQCGIQFRLTNHKSLKVDKSLVHPSGHIDIYGALRAMVRRIEQEPEFVGDRTTVIVAPECWDTGQAESGSTLPPVGVTDRGTGALCMPRGTTDDLVLAHELGHVLSLDHHPVCTGDYLMCERAIGPRLTSSECQKARVKAKALSP